MKTIVPGFLLLLFIIPSVSAEGIWHSYSNIGDIHDIEAQGDYLWCATSGGAVRVDTRDKSYSVFRTQDGLVDNYVRTVAIDSSGVVWFGTQNGLSSFDGSNWISYTTENELIDDDISGIEVRSDNAIYVTMNGAHKKDMVYWHTHGLQRIHGGEWHTLINSKDTYNMGAQSLYLDESNNCLWIGSWSGLFFFQYTLDGVRIKSHENKWTGSSYQLPLIITDAATDNDNITWFAANGLWSYNGTTWTKYSDQENWLLTGVVNSVLADTDNCKWVGSSEGLFFYDGEVWDVFPLEDGMKYFYNLVRGSDGVLYGSTNKDIAFFDGEKVVPYVEIREVPTTHVEDVVVDADNVIWFTAQEDTSYGAASFDGISWKHYTVEDGLISDSVYDITVDGKNNKWFATRHGISRFDGNNWTSYSVETGDLSYNKCYTIATDRSGNVWAGMNNGDVYHFNGDSWETFHPPKEWRQRIVDMAFDHHNTLWIANGGRIISFDGETWERYDNMDGHNSVFVDHNDVLWMGHVWGGLYSFNNGVYNQVDIEELDDTKKIITSISEDNNGILWFTIIVNAHILSWNDVNRGYVASYDRESFTLYTRENSGLIDNRVNSVAIDNNNVKWFATEGGVSSFDDYDPTLVQTSQLQAKEMVTVSQNPLNISTTINYSIAEPSNVKLVIYSISGQKVSTLVDGFMPAGKHAATFDGSNLASGVYFYSFESRGFKNTGKMLLIK